MNSTLRPTITTVIPTYRRPELLRRAIQSVLQQTYPHFQVCVCDNASGDETASVVAELAKADPRVKYYCHAENIGAFANFQFGLNRVETPFFSILSDDDLVLPNFYETALSAFEGRADVMLSATDVIHLGTHDRILRMALEKWTPGFYYPPNGLMAVLDNGHSEWTGILFRKEVTKAVGLLDEATGKYSDLDFALRIAARCPFVVTKRPCAVFNLSTAHARAPHSFDSSWPGVIEMVRHLTADESLPLDVRAYAERVLMGRFEEGLFASGVVYLSRGYPAEAKKVAALLRGQFRSWARYIALSAMTYVHQSVPFARMAFDALVARRRRLRANRIRSSTEQYPRFSYTSSSAGSS
jgi:glycosyltransferase involved in cell wall biosynthesis